MIRDKDFKELREVSETVFAFCEGYAMQLLSEDIQRREFEVLSVDLAARLSYLAELIVLFADELGMTDYETRFEVPPCFVSEAAKMYLCPLYKDKK